MKPTMVCCPCLCSGTQLHWIYVGVGSQPYRSWLSTSFRDEFDAVSSEKLLQFKDQIRNSDIYTDPDETIEPFVVVSLFTCSPKTETVETVRK